MNKQQEIYKALSVLSLLKNDISSKERLMIYCKLLDKYPIENIKAAIARLATESRFFPDVSEIVKIICPKKEVDQLAIEISDKIIESISAFGWCNGASAREYIGEIGWEIVSRMGGWENITKVKIDDIGVLRSQLRASAKSAVKTRSLDALEYKQFNQIEEM